MPELPEAETIARGLSHQLSGRIITQVRSLRTDMVNLSPRTLKKHLQGKKIIGVGRVGKKVLLQMNDGIRLVFSLGMSGQLYLLGKKEALPNHTHMILGFSRWNYSLIFRDPRRFGRIDLIGKDSKKGVCNSLDKLGADALSISETEFASLISAKKREIKPLLLDQTCICGLGNIYVDECLFRARIHPLRRADRLTQGEVRRLYRAMCQVLLEAIRAGGSSISDYVDASGAMGRFQTRHRVYGREGEPCPVCGTKILKIRVGGRGTYFCPVCQKTV
jgi:formamidopyrimidine-DNA glycosylase